MLSGDAFDLRRHNAPSLLSGAAPTPTDAPMARGRSCGESRIGGAATVAKLQDNHTVPRTWMARARLEEAETLPARLASEL
ncbi:hypothetical protein [Xanthomonas sp. WHRI 7945]|nr:hypothetical protein [Xanthomonas campestris pv. campestris]